MHKSINVCVHIFGYNTDTDNFGIDLRIGITAAIIKCGHCVEKSDSAVHVICVNVNFRSVAYHKIGIERWRKKARDRERSYCSDWIEFILHFVNPGLSNLVLTRSLQAKEKSPGRSSSTKFFFLFCYNVIFIYDHNIYLVSINHARFIKQYFFKMIFERIFTYLATLIAITRLVYFETNGWNQPRHRLKTVFKTRSRERYLYIFPFLLPLSFENCDIHRTFVIIFRWFVDNASNNNTYYVFYIYYYTFNNIQTPIMYLSRCIMQVRFCIRF